MKLPALLIGLAVLLSATACVSFVGGEGGGISPSQFKFEPYVPPGASGPGGWKAARVIITLVRQANGGLRNVMCEVQVEVPEVNHLGPVLDEFAQQEAAKAADAAAERVLPQGLLSAEMCQRFYEEMRKILEVPIPGARVRRFIDIKGSTKKGSSR